ncbi:hypothetical protein HY468_05150 [Candidatus Roizmanbacteria bacterium]|nr:hypothetical protein [Candidatus Roizmanbacteria bacterium]
MTTGELGILLDKKLRPLQKSIKSMETNLHSEIQTLGKRVTGVESSFQDQIKSVEDNLTIRIINVESTLRGEIKDTEKRLGKKIQKEIRKEENLLQTSFSNLIKQEVGKQIEQFEVLKSAIEKAFERTTRRFESLEERIDTIDQRTQPL